MLTKLYIFGLLCSTACPLPNSKSNEETASSTPVNQTLSCADQIGWMKNTTLEAKKQYEEYYAQLAANNISVTNLGDIKNQHDQIKKLIAISLERYTVDLDKVRAMEADDEDQLKICKEVLNRFSIMNQQLSALTQSIRPKVIDIAKKLGLRHDAVDELDQTLARIVMLIIDIGNHTVEHTFIKKGLETVGMLKKEIIGQLEEPTTGIAQKQIDTPDGVANVATDSTYDELDDEKDEKAFEDLLDGHDQDIKKADKELYQREEQWAQLAKEQRLTEAERLAWKERQKEVYRLQENEGKEILIGFPDIVRLL